MDEFNDPYLDELLAGAPKPKPQVTANLLRKPPQRETTSVPGTVAGQESAYGYSPVPQVTPHPGYMSQQSKPVPGYIAPQGVSSLRGDQVQSAQQAVARDQAEMERLQSPQDYSSMQAQMKEQQAGGQRALLLALAAQEAGREFAPVQGAFLKRAMEARQPMRTATGMINEAGEHIEDPMAKAEQKMKLLQARIAQNNQIIQSAATAEEKAEAQRQTQIAQEEMKRLMISSQQAMAAQSSSDRRYAADLAATTSRSNAQLAHEDRVAARQATQGKMLPADEKLITEARQGIAAVTSALDAVKKAPHAFGGMQGATDYLPGTVGQVAMATRDRFLDDDALAARAMVYNNVSAVIKERAGTAQSAQELKRLNSFLPAPTDTDREVTIKLRAFGEFLREQGDAVSSKYANPLHTVDSRPTAPPAAPTGPAPVQQRVQGYYSQPR